MKKIFSLFFAIIIVLSANAAAVQGAYAYDLKLTQSGNDYTFSFRSSAAAPSGQLILTNKSTNATYTYSINNINSSSTYNFTLNKNKIATGEYSWKVVINNDASDAITRYYNYGSTPDATLGNRGGVAIDLDTESKNYGYVYVSRAKAGGGILRYTPKLAMIDNGFILADKFLAEGSTSSPYRIKSNSGKLYIADYSDPNGGIFVYDPNNGNFSQMFQGTHASSGQWTNNGVIVGGSVTGLAFNGEGSNRKMYAFVEDYNPTNQLVRYDLGTSDTWDKAPSKVYSEVSKYLRKNNIEIVPCEKGLWICQNKYDTSTNGYHDENTPMFLFIDYDGNIKFNSNSSSFLGTTSGSYAFESGIAISNDMSRLAVAGGGNINYSNVRIYNISWNGNTPTLSFDYEIDLGHTNSGSGAVEQIVFDPADNLLLFSRQYGLMAYTLKNPARSTVTDAPSSQVAVGAGDISFEQVTEGEGDEKKYSFDLKFEVNYIADAEQPSNNLYTITASSEILNELIARKYVCYDANGNDITSSVTLHNFIETDANLNTESGNNYSVGKCIALEFPAVKSAKLPTIIWKNVNPELKYDVTVYVVGDYECNAIKSFSEEMTIPSATLTMTDIIAQPLAGDYSKMQSDDILPLGAKRKVGSEEVTNPITLNNANILGTRGSAINPLMVTDDVMNDWIIQYDCILCKNGKYELEGTAPSSNDETGKNLYSNKFKTAFDIIGFPITTEDWNTHDVMKLSDTQKATNDNITKQKYSTKTAENNYSIYIRTSYTRKSDNVSIEKDGSTDAIIDIPMSDLLKNGNAFPALKVDYTAPIALFKRTTTHWDASCTTNGGYYSTYYDAAAQWSWSDYNDNLNRYIGFHAVTQTNCVGHYVTDSEGNKSNTWIPYYAPSVLNDYYVEQDNITLSKGDNANPDPEGKTLRLEKIGYDGTAKTNWSKLAADACTLPMEIHYVWAGNRDLTNSDEDRKSMMMTMLLTADYPIFEGLIFMFDEFVDGENYSVEEFIDIDKRKLKVISIDNKRNVYADYVANTTGVEDVDDVCDDVKIFPNPVESSFTLQAPTAINDVKIFTIDGQLVKVVKNCNDTTTTINISELPQGVYLVNALGKLTKIIKL